MFLCVTRAVCKPIAIDGRSAADAVYSIALRHIAWPESRMTLPTIRPAAWAIGICLVASSFFAVFASSLGAQTSSPSAALAADLQRGQAALKANDQAAAAQQFRAALKLDPSNVEAHANLGVMSFFHGDCADAEKEFKSALRAAPGLTRAQALMAVCERRLGQPEAQADMESAFAKLDDAKLRTQVGIELADVYYQQGELEKTVSVLHQLLNLNPDNVDILFFAQRVYSELADNTLNKLAVLAPGSARMEQLIAERLINAGDLILSCPVCTLNLPRR